MTYVLSVATNRNRDLASTIPPERPVPVALSFAIVQMYWPPSADHVWASEVGKGFVSDPQQSVPSSSSRRVPSPLCEYLEV
jgi:hypothetical protein